MRTIVRLSVPSLGMVDAIPPVSPLLLTEDARREAIQKRQENVRALSVSLHHSLDFRTEAASVTPGVVA